jgi:hypothetical protein
MLWLFLASVTATAAIVVAVIPGLLAAYIIQNKLVLLVLLVLRQLAMISINEKSIAERVNSIQGELRCLIDAHEQGTYNEGPEALAASVLKLVSDASLIETRVCDLGNVGTFPGNRENSMLVPADVHGLLYETLYVNGFNAEKWDCMCLTVPPSKKAAWLKANKDLVDSSNGLLPPIADLDLVTGRGSHGTSALRACKVGCRSVYPEIAGPNGMVSFAKIVERQPSMKEPVEKGVAIKIIRGELEEAVPGMFQVLSRLGNVTNAHYRLQTTLQSCVRIHSLATQMPHDQEINWDKVGRQASIGMMPSEATNVAKLCIFVKNWSGGVKREILTDLENYEKTLSHKRFIWCDDMAILGECDAQYPRIVPAFLELALYFMRASPDFMGPHVSKPIKTCW